MWYFNVDSFFHQECSYFDQFFVILHIPTQDYLPDVLYVGETESIRQRLQQHRAHYKAQGYSFNAAVAAVAGGKSAARRAETTLISALKSKGFDIENDSDSKHVLFGSSGK